MLDFGIVLGEIESENLRQRDLILVYSTLAKKACGPYGPRGFKSHPRRQNNFEAIAEDNSVEDF